MLSLINALWEIFDILFHWNTIVVTLYSNVFCLSHYVFLILFENLIVILANYADLVITELFRIRILQIQWQSLIKLNIKIEGATIADDSLFTEVLYRNSDKKHLYKKE